MSSNIPIALLKEAIGHVVVVEMTNKEEYRGKLKSCEDTMNVTLNAVVHTARDGSKTKLFEVFLRGSAVRMFLLPEVISKAPILRGVKASAPSTATAGAEAGTQQQQQQQQQSAKRKPDATSSSEAGVGSSHTRTTTSMTNNNNSSSPSTTTATTTNDRPIPEHLDLLIVGAGPTGLGAAHRIHQLNEIGALEKSWMMVDAFAEAGGLASTGITPEGFLFDVGAHVIFSHYSFFDDLLEKCVGKFDDTAKWLTHQRECYVRYKNRWVPYPFQNNLSSLPEDDQVRVITGMIEAKVKAAVGEVKKAPPPANFDEWFVCTMGEGLAEIFMRPYNYKVWAIPPKLMQWTWLGERVAVVDPTRAVTNAIKKVEDLGWGPNAVFRFPPAGGTHSIWKSVAAALPEEKKRFNTALVALDLTKRVATLRCSTPTGEKTYEVSYGKMLSTVPVDVLVTRVMRTFGGDLAEDPEDERRREKFLKAAATGKLVHSNTNVVGLGIRGANPHGTMCWLYFPESTAPFYRAAIFSHFAPGNTPPPDVKLETIHLASATGPLSPPTASQGKRAPGPYWSLMLEISENHIHKSVNQETLMEECIRGCVASGLLKEGDEIVSLYHRRLEHGYPTPSLERDDGLRCLLPYLRGHGVWSRGRFGSYKYEVANQDHSLALGVEAVDNMFFGTEEVTLNRPSFVNRNVGSQINRQPAFGTAPPVPPREAKYPAPDTFMIGEEEEFKTEVSWLRGRVFASTAEYVSYVNQMQRGQ